MALPDRPTERVLFDSFNDWRGTEDVPEALLDVLAATALKTQIDIIGTPIDLNWNTERGDDIADLLTQPDQGGRRREVATTHLLGGTVVSALSAREIWVAEARPSQLKDETTGQQIRHWRFDLTSVVYLANAGWPIDPRGEVQVVENSVHRQLTAWERMQRQMRSNEYWFGSISGPRCLDAR